MAWHKRWEVCCPPKGLKADIVKALEAHAAAKTKGTALAEKDDDDKKEESAARKVKAAVADEPKTDESKGGKTKSRTSTGKNEPTDVSDGSAKALFGEVPLPCQTLYNGEHKEADLRTFSGSLYRRDVPLLDDVHQGDVRGRRRRHPAAGECATRSRIS